MTYSAAHGTGVSVDSHGNSYITIATSDAQVGVLNKYNAAGQRLWSLLFNGAEDDFAQSVAVDAAGFCYLTGRASPGAQIDTFHVIGSSPSGFVSKVSPSGNVLWLQMMGAKSTGRAVAVDQSGSAYVTGSFSDKVQFGDAVLTNRTASGLFLGRIDQPGLRISRAADRVAMSWPALAAGSHLESSEMASGPWVNAAGVPMPVEDQLLLLDEVGAGNRFYRLRP
jgi:hypothetical protein